MPIFAYRCADCGFEKDALQKRHDPPLVDCPACGQPRLARRLSAPAFQLKGSGWYVTDFRDGAKAKGKDDAAAGDAKAGEGSADGARTESPSKDAAAAGKAAGGDGAPASGASTTPPAGGASTAPPAGGASPAPGQGASGGAASSGSTGAAPAKASGSSTGGGQKAA